jgi:ribonuclease HII
VDEAGRGPLAGPVVAAAVIFRPEDRVPGVTDSKQLTEVAREELVVEIRRRALCIGVGAASPQEVDRLNILRATHLAMRRALSRLALEPDHVLVDGLPAELGCEHTAVVDGDVKSYTIACASIVAKTTRDRLMKRLAARYPQYGWSTNVGYGTPEHVMALGDLGPTPHHRRSFVPVQLALDLS